MELVKVNDTYIDLSKVFRFNSRVKRMDVKSEEIKVLALYDTEGSVILKLTEESASKVESYLESKAETL